MRHEPGEPPLRCGSTPCPSGGLSEAADPRSANTLLRDRIMPVAASPDNPRFRCTRSYPRSKRHCTCSKIRTTRIRCKHKHSCMDCIATRTCTDGHMECHRPSTSTLRATRPAPACKSRPKFPSCSACRKRRKTCRCQRNRRWASRLPARRPRTSCHRTLDPAGPIWVRPQARGLS